MMLDNDFFVLRDDQVNVVFGWRFQSGCCAHISPPSPLPCPGRAAACFTLLHRAGTVPNAALCFDPGSAAHHAAKKRRAALRPGHENYFSACSASYSAWLQPAPADASLCSGIAALRNASRSTVTTVLPSLRSSSAIFCSEVRISSDALAAACLRTSSNTFLSSSDNLDQTCEPTMVSSDSMMCPVSMM